MGIAEQILIVLWVVVLIMLCYQLSAIGTVPRQAPPGFDIGASMTIGTRELQEDCQSTLMTQAGVMAVLADGMGKAFGGRIASRTAVETFKEIFADYNAFDNPPYFFRKAFNSANREVLKMLDNGQVGSASVGAVLILQDKLYYAVAGNVKICVYRAGELVEMSVGHTINRLAQQGFKTGRVSREYAITLLEDHRLYNYIGQDEFHDIELYDTPIHLKKNDIVLLMSDGVYEPLPWKELEEVLGTGVACQDMALEIVEKINRLEAEDKDNASLVLIRM